MLLAVTLAVALAAPDCPANCASLLEMEATCEATSFDEGMCEAVGMWHEDLCVEPMSTPCDEMCDELERLANLCTASFGTSEGTCGDAVSLAETCRSQDVEAEPPGTSTPAEDSGALATVDSGTRPPPAAEQASGRESAGCATSTPLPTFLLGWLQRR